MTGGMGRDLTFAIRSLRRAPLFTAAAVLTLSLGIGVASAVFSLADRVLFRALPYAEGRRLVSVGVRAPIAEGAVLLGGDYSEWKEERSAFEAFTSTRGVAACDITETNPIRTSCAAVEWNFLPVFGVRPAAGRSFTPEEDRPKAAPVALISHGLWQARYGGDPKMEGREMNLDGRPVKIIGVLPESFEFPTLARVDVLMPQQLDEAVERKRESVTLVTAFGRLRRGVGIAQARAALDPYFGNFLKTIHPGFRKEVRLDLTPLDDLLRQRARTVAWVLLAAVLCVLLIAWTNVANLWLARAAGKVQENRIREALGAGFKRMMMHRAAEFTILSAVGWAGGLAVAAGLLAVLRRTAPEGIIGMRQASLDGRILLFSAVVLAACTLAFALLPSRGEGAGQGHGSRVAGVQGMRLRSVLVTAQLALSVVLVTSAGLLLRSLWELSRIDIGVRTEGAVTATVVLGQHHFRTGAERYAFVQRLESGLHRLPGVTSAAVADELPPLAAGTPFMYSSIAVDGVPLPGREPGGRATARHVTPGYFQTLQIPLRRGRAFAPSDMDSAAGVTILSERLARRLFGDGDPNGHTVKPAGWPKTYTVLGVAANVKNAGLTAEDALEMYLPFDHTDGTSRFVSAVVRSTAQPDLMVQLMTNEIRRLDPTLPARIEPFPARLAGLNERLRFNALLLSFFAVAGLLLAGLGVYGVLAYLVSQRVHEIGVRMALGATHGWIVWWIVGFAMRWAAAGILIGVAVVIAAESRIQSMLYGVTPGDPRTIAAIVVLLAAVAALAAFVPARRAAMLDPSETLRQE